jgi:copper homeostasis protein
VALLEVAVDSIEGVLAAREGGASRIELCSRLDLGGLSPAPELLREAIERSPLPLCVMVRPRPGDFVYSREEVEAMEREVAALREARVAGAVFGALTREGRVDGATTRRLVCAARPLAVTFHRAFDQAGDLDLAIEDLVALGVDRVLTSGGAKDAHAGRHHLRALVERARGRIVVLAGGGVRPANAAAILADAGVAELHGSVAFRPPA